MRNVIFLVCLCSLLLKGSQYVYTGIHHYSVGYYAAHKEDKRNHLGQPGQIRHLSQFRDLGLIYEEGLACEDLEDEVEYNHSYHTRKAWWPAKGNPPPVQIAELHYLNNYSNNLLPFCGYLPNIYLTQRALRI